MFLLFPATSMKNSPQDTEAKLKALLFGRLDSASSSGNTTPGFNSPMSKYSLPLYTHHTD